MLCMIHNVYFTKGECCGYCAQMEDRMTTETKIPMLKWEHPKFSGYLITEPTETRESVAANNLGDDLEPGDLEAFTVTEIHMTREDIDALPEFDG